MTLYNYSIDFESCSDLHNPQNGMRYEHEQLDNGISMSPIIKINHKFVEGTLFSVECSGRKKSTGYNEILFTKENWKFWYKGYDGYDYMMIELDDYTFHRWGEMPFLVLRGNVGVETTGQKYVYVKECFTCDLTYYDNNSDIPPYCDKDKLVHCYNESDSNVYYDYTSILDTMSKSKL